MNARIAGFELVTPDAGRLAEFYVRGLGFTHEGGRLRLGAQIVHLVPAVAAARPIPTDSTASDLWFQHLAIVTSDINRAVALALAAGAAAITVGGPQHLPRRAGGVTAWKFRDPDRHPLELLQFPPDATPPGWRAAGLHLGIDHSAISVADVEASIAWYRQQFGFMPASRQVNDGAEQSWLDGLADARAEVVALAPPRGATPHLELLGYRPAGRPSAMTADDVAATRIVVESDGGAPAALVRDPDGHCARWAAA